MWNLGRMRDDVVIGTFLLVLAGAGGFGLVGVLWICYRAFQ